MKNKYKKGQLAGLVPVILTLIVAAFFLVLGIQLLAGFQNATDDYSGSATENGAFVNSTGYTLVKSTVTGFNNPTVTIINASNGNAITSYSLVNNVLYNSTATVYPVVNITYTYNYGQEAYSAANKSIIADAGFADYWQIIILAIVIGVVITLLLVVFNTRKIR